MTDRVHNHRQSFYNWRQRNPVSRFALAAVFLVLYPFRSAIFGLLDVFAKAEKSKRILVIQLAGLGDTLMLTPAVAALSDAYPGSKIDFITLHGYVKEAFSSHPRFNAIAKLPNYPGQWIIAKFCNRSGAKLLWAALQFYPRLLVKHAFSRYDVGINFGLVDFDRKVGNALLYLLNVRRRVGSSGVNDQLLTNVAPAGDPRKYRPEAYLDFLKPLGISGGETVYEFPVYANDVSAVKLALGRAGADVSRPLAVIHPGGKLHINSRRWPAEHFLHVCCFLSEQQGFQVVLSGDENDAEVCKQISRNDGGEVKSLAGCLSFAETAALLSLAELCLTNDTATLHLAEAVQVPRVISLFGPTDPDVLAPKNDRHIVFRSKLECAPCMGGIIDGNSERCRRDVKEECLSGIAPDQVIAVLDQLYPSSQARVARA